MAESIGTGKAYISQIENLRTTPSPEMVVSISKHLGLIPEEMLRIVCNEKIDQVKADIRYKYRWRKE